MAEIVVYFLPGPDKNIKISNFPLERLVHHNLPNHVNIILSYIDLLKFIFVSHKILAKQNEMMVIEIFQA